jgi:hypothetical protein
MDFEPVLRLARDYANSDARKPEWVSYDAPTRSEYLELFFDADSVRGHIQAARSRGTLHESDDEIYENITQIATDSVKRALSEYKNGTLLAELIVENIKNGRDAFATGTDD